MYIGVAVASCMLLFSTVSVVMIYGALKKFKSKMEEAGAGIETIVDKFKKAGEKYNEQIENLQKDVAALKDGSSTKEETKKKSEDKKPTEKAEKSEKTEKKSEEKKSEDKKSDDKKDESSKEKSSSKESKKDSSEITFKDDTDAKKSSDI